MLASREHPSSAVLDRGSKLRTGAATVTVSSRTAQSRCGSAGELLAWRPIVRDSRDSSPWGAPTATASLPVPVAECKPPLEVPVSDRAPSPPVRLCAPYLLARTRTNSHDLDGRSKKPKHARAKSVRRSENANKNPENSRKTKENPFGPWCRHFPVPYELIIKRPGGPCQNRHWGDCQNEYHYRYSRSDATSMGFWTGLEG